MDPSRKITNDDSTKKAKHGAVKKLQDDTQDSMKNISSYMKTRNEEDLLLKSKQEERSKIRVEVVDMKGQLRYDRVQMPSIEKNLCQIDEKKNLIEGYTTKIKTTLPDVSDASLAIKEKLLQQKNYVDDFLSDLHAKLEETEKERALVEERKREVKQKFKEAVECLKSKGLKVTNNSERLKSNTRGLQETIKQITVNDELVTQKIEKVREQKALLKKQLDDKKQRQRELLQEVHQQKVVFECAQREQVENVTNLLEKVQEAESEQKALELQKVKKEGSTINMLKALEVKDVENSNLKLKNDELAITLNQAEIKMEDDKKKMEVEFSSKVEESEKSKNVNKELAAVLDDFEKKLVHGKQAQQEIDLKIEDHKTKVEKLKMECEQLQKCNQEDFKRIERLKEELSMTQNAIVNSNEKLSKQNDIDDMQGETKLKEIELEIEIRRMKTDETIAEIVNDNNQLAMEFEEQTKSEMESFENKRREMEKKNRILRENLDDTSMAIKELEEGLSEKHEEMVELVRTKNLLKSAETSAPIPPKRTRKPNASYSQAPKAGVGKISRFKKATPSSQSVHNSATRSTTQNQPKPPILEAGKSIGLKEATSCSQPPERSATRSVGLKKVDVDSFLVTSPNKKRRTFDDTSNSSADSLSYNFSTFATMRQEQIKQSNMVNKKK